MEWVTNCDYGIARVDSRRANMSHIFESSCGLKESEIVSFILRHHPQNRCRLASQIAMNIANTSVYHVAVSKHVTTSAYYKPCAVHID
jgi:hypothetical protein